MTGATESRLSQEHFAMLADLAISIHERLKVAKQLIQAKKGSSPSPVVDSVEEAHEYLRHVAQREELREDLRDVAADFKVAGMPQKIWIRHSWQAPEDLGTPKKYKILLEPAPNDPGYRLLIDTA